MENKHPLLLEIENSSAAAIAHDGISDGIDDGISDGVNDGIAIPKNIQPLLQCIKQSPSLSAKAFSKQLNIGTATVERHIKWLKDNKIIERIGSNKDGYWQVLSDEK